MVLLGLAFFLPAGTLRYWQAWGYLGLMAVLMLGVLLYLLKHDPELLERRIQTREKERGQKLIVRLSFLFFSIAFLVPGLDRRFGWSFMPGWLVACGFLMVLAGYGLFVMVLRVNSYASRVVEVSRDQQVISSGPYSVVRHPMYSAVLILYGFTPLALGSYWALLANLFWLWIFIPRILNEEKVLAEQLDGYKEYMQKIRYRLIPGIW